jgi:hypothetical protein
VPKTSNSIFVIAMNQAKYDSLPPDLKAVIDANSGIELSKHIGKVFDGTTEGGKKLARDADGVFDTLSPAEYDRWVKATDGGREGMGRRGQREGRERPGAARRREGADQKHGG